MRSVRPKRQGKALRALISTILCLAAFSACDGGGESIDIAFELALPVDSLSCSTGTVVRPPEIDGMPCATVRLFEESASGALTPVRLFDPDGDHSLEGELERRVQLDETRRIRFDARIPLPETEHTLVFRIFDASGDPVFGATVVDRRLGPDEERLRVRLYPFQEFACAGGGLGDGLARALHEAVSLPNGDVVIFGGVTGRDLPGTSANDLSTPAGATLERSVLLYDASEHEFVRLEGEEFGRVGFGARYVGTDEGGRHRIQVVGGYVPEAAQSSPLVLLDNGARFAPFAAPFSFSLRPQPQEPVELLIDVSGRSVEVRPLPLTPVSIGGFAEVSETIDVPTAGAAALVLPGLLPTEADTPRQLDNSYFFLTEGARANTPSAASGVGRLGATVTALPNQAAWLVWGGGVGMGPMTDPLPDIRDVAGELIAIDGVRQVLAAGSGIPEPTAFHTATRFPDDDTVVFVGGYELRVSRDIGVRPSMTPIVALRFTGATVLPRVIAECEFVMVGEDELVSDCTYQNTAFHTATVVPGLGLVIVGGARTVDELNPGGARRFMAANSVTVVTGGLELQTLPATLTRPRFGHTATLLPGNRLLVVGGFADDDTSFALSAVSEPEMIYLEKVPPRVVGTQCIDTSDLPDAGMDAGVDAGEFVFDAGLDAGPDGGPDAGLPDGALPDGALPDGAMPDTGVDGG